MKSERICPRCGSVVKRENKGYSCPNPECEVIKLKYYPWSNRVKRVVVEGPGTMGLFGRGHKHSGKFQGS